MIFPTERITAIEFMVALDGDTVKQTRYLLKPSTSQELSSEIVELHSGEVAKKWFIQPTLDPLEPDKWYGPGDVIPILAQATPGKTLSYSISGHYLNVMMHETNPGMYEAYHKVDTYTPLFEGPIEFSLKGKWLTRSKASSSEIIKVGGLPIQVWSIPRCLSEYWFGFGQIRRGPSMARFLDRAIIVGEQMDCITAKFLCILGYPNALWI